MIPLAMDDTDTTSARHDGLTQRHAQDDINISPASFTTTIKMPKYKQHTMFNYCCVASLFMRFRHDQLYHQRRSAESQRMLGAMLHLLDHFASTTSNKQAPCIRRKHGLCFAAALLASQGVKMHQEPGVEEHRLHTAP